MTTRHLTEDQIARWVIDQSTVEERQHVRTCHQCHGTLDRFRNTLASFQSAVADRARRSAGRSPRLSVILQQRMAREVRFGTSVSESRSWLVSLPASLLWTVRGIFWNRPRTIEISSVPVDVKDLWGLDNSGYAGLLSVGAHALVVLLLVIPATRAFFEPSPKVTSAVMLTPLPLTLDLRNNAGVSSGGGGGGRETLTPPSKGQLPRGAEKQMLPPLVEIKNLAPALVLEPTLVAPQLSTVTPPIMQFGDPNGVVGPPSAGPGTGGGVGDGGGTGIGPGKGPGFGPGSDGGVGDGVYGVGGGVSAPVPIYRPQPEYSEDARKGRIQGIVELVVIVNPDGSVRIASVRTSLGYGLDQKAIDAVRTWRFVPGRKNGVPVATSISVLVNFSVR